MNTLLAQSAQIQLDAAILAVNAFGPGTTLGSDLTGTILPGTYTVPAGPTNLSGALVLDGGGNSNAVWVFLFPSTLITSNTSTVSVVNVGNGSGVGLYWSVESSATLNGNVFAGNVLANDLISSNGDLNLGCGRLLSAETQVTLIHDQISTGCGVSGSVGFESNGFNQGNLSGSSGGGGGTPSVPEPTTVGLIASGLILLGWRQRKV
jgi:hypothetical protein